MNESTARTSNMDYMRHGFEIIREPLNLKDAGQAWYRRVFGGQIDAAFCQRVRDEPHGLVLGATAWLTRVIVAITPRVIVIDKNLAMLAMAHNHVPDDVSMIAGDWLSLPEMPGPISIAVGDNSFSFVPFPEGWYELCDQLAGKMKPGAKLITRCFSMPRPKRIRESPAAIAGEFIARARAGENINYTEVRARLLFSQCDPITSRIDAQDVYGLFESNRAAFAELYELSPTVDADDLSTIEKYKDSGALYYAPDLDQIADVFREQFRVDEIRFGPYPMAECFPLIVATRL
jgi:hypothetical protein